MSIKIKLHSTTGKKVTDMTVSDTVLGQSWNDELVHQVATSIASNDRPSVAHTKTRGEVRGGGKKPWKQKGTGRARHGSIRSPIWKGGGVTFGPRVDKSYDKKINKKMRAKALYAILSKKLTNGSLIFLDSIDIKEIKTKSAVEILKNVDSAFKDARGKTLVVLPQIEDIARRSFNNIPRVQVIDVSGLNAHSALSFGKIIITNPEEVLKALEKREKTISKNATPIVI